MLLTIDEFKTQLIYLCSAFSVLDKEWQELLMVNCGAELVAIDKKLQQIVTTNIIYPAKELTFNALKYTKISDIKVVIIGQDPYHGFNEATGLAFAVNDDVRKPPSLRNIYIEVLNSFKTEISAEIKNRAQLENNLLFSWAKQGVLLLNATLTVIKDKPNSLSACGWQLITDKIINLISRNSSPIVFLLWGSFAKSKACLIDQAKHLVLTAPHPSPFSAHKGFFGCNHFRLANDYLIRVNKNKIHWIPDFVA